MADIELLSDVLSTVDTNTRKPENFLSVQNDAALHFKNSIKRLYDFTKEQTRRNTNALPELVAEGFDEEQIWQQLELQNEGELSYFLKGVSRVLARKNLIVPLTTTKPEPKEVPVPEPKEEESEEEDIASEPEIEEEAVSDEEMPADIGSRNNSKEAKSILRQKKKSSIVDDKFFKLQDLDDYLTKEDKKEGQPSKPAEDSDEESVDLFNDDSEEEEEDSGDGKLVKYADFFDNPDSEDERLNESRDSNFHKDDGDSDDDNSLQLSDAGDEMDSDEGRMLPRPASKKVKFNLTNDSDETDSTENKSSIHKDDSAGKSSLELRQERLQKKIKHMEEAALSEKPWQLKGEVSATNRPQNSLLEEFVEFDITMRPPPVITEQTTMKLEDIIRQRIKDKAWDDVEKKFKPVETPLEYKKKLILNQEKSKESLSQIYENEYLKQKQALNPDNIEVEEEEPKLHKEIRELGHLVYKKLDALSNFHYTPKMAKPELKIISNVPAIAMEEVAPVAMSDGALLAPEEVKARPRGEVIGKAERTQTDMKRARRQKKMKQHARQEAVEKKEKLNALKPGIEKKYKKDKATALVKKLTKDRNIAKMDETSGKTAKSSTAFFNQLQDQAKSLIKAKAAPTPKKKQKNAVSAVKLKL